MHGRHLIVKSGVGRKGGRKHARKKIMGEGMRRERGRKARKLPAKNNYIPFPKH